MTPKELKLTDDDIERLKARANHDAASDNNWVSPTDAIRSAVDMIMTASGLNEMAAKTCVYYAVGTYGLGQLNLYPLLVFYGATGTGKSTAMKALSKLTHNSMWLGTKLTQASLRDKLKEAKDATAFIEEGDAAYEDYIANRYSRETSSSSVKCPSKFGWTDINVNYFGATILHKRRPFNDPATDSRSIIIRTRPKAGSYELIDIPGGLRAALADIWLAASHIYNAMDVSSRAADVWKPLMAAAMACGDEEWLRYVNSELAKAEDKLRLGQDFEPEALVVNALIALSHRKKDGDLVSLTDVKDELRKETNWQPSSWSLANMLRELGFEVRKSHGQRKIGINKLQLATIGEELGIEGAFEDAIEITTRNLID